MTPLQEAARTLRRAALGAIRIREKDRLAAKHRKPIASFFRMQKGMVLSELEKNAYLFSESFRKLAEESPVDFTLQNWDRIWDGISRDSFDELQRIIVNAEVDGLKAGSTRSSKHFAMTGPTATGSTFSLANPRAVDWFRQNGGSVDMIRGIQQTTGDQLKTIIGDAIDGGKSYTQLSKEIRIKFDEYSAKLPGKKISRADLIAINETGKAYEEGNAEFGRSLQDAGIKMTKTWMTSHDSKVSDGCRDNEDEGPIPINQYHRSGHQQPPRFPGCRCYEIYEPAEA